MRKDRPLSPWQFHSRLTGRGPGPIPGPVAKDKGTIGPPAGTIGPLAGLTMGLGPEAIDCSNWLS